MNEHITYLLLFATGHDHALRALVAAGAVALRQGVPRRDRCLAFTSTTFTTTVRVIHRFIATPRTVGRIPSQRRAPAPY